MTLSPKPVVVVFGVMASVGWVAYATVNDPLGDEGLPRPSAASVAVNV